MCESVSKCVRKTSHVRSVCVCVQACFFQGKCGQHVSDSFTLSSQSCPLRALLWLCQPWGSSAAPCLFPAGRVTGSGRELELHFHLRPCETLLA